MARCPSITFISPDAIREELYPGYELGQVEHRHIDHHRVFRMAYHAVAEVLHARWDVLFDATSLTVTRRRKLVLLAHREQAATSARYFPIDLAEAFRRNSLRPRQVPPGIIAYMAKVLQPPTRDEGFDRVVTHHSPLRCRRNAQSP